MMDGCLSFEIRGVTDKKWCAQAVRHFRAVSLAFTPVARCELLRKEVIQPHVPVRLPCYDLAPVTGFTLGGSFLAVRTPTSGTTGFHGLTGGVYKARERIHRAVLMRDY
jgi:hypothetical protein